MRTGSVSVAERGVARGRLAIWIATLVVQGGPLCFMGCASREHQPAAVLGRAGEPDGSVPAEIDVGARGSGLDSAVPGDPIDAGSAARVFAEAVCQAVHDCSPVYAFERTPSGLDSSTIVVSPPTCEAQLTVLYEEWLAAPGSGFTPEGMRECAVRYERLFCAGSDGRDVDWPPTCFPRGSVNVGSACIYDAQCETGWCSVVAGHSGCGVCAELAREGESCVVDGCAGSLVCDRPTGDALTCQRAHVNPDIPIYPLVPLGGACVPERGWTEPCAFGSFCDPATNTCHAWPAPGEDCSLGGGRCTEGYCVSGGHYGPSRCFPLARQGEACESPGLISQSPACESPLLCIGNVCRLPDVALCP